jgi:molybdopterin adenylyltransferase
MSAAHGSDDLEQVGFAVLTVSDSRGAADDTSGDLIRELAISAGHRVLASGLVRDDEAAIALELRGMLSQEGVDVAVLTGGTGLSPRDVTLEAIEPLFEREIEGFGELFRSLSYAEIGPRAMLSRAIAGVVGMQAVFALPGSPKAVRLGMEKLVLPAVGHLLGQVRRRYPPPATPNTTGGTAGG